MAKSQSFPAVVGRWIGFLLLGLCMVSLLVIGMLRFVDPPTSAFMLIDRWHHPERRTRQRWIDLESISPWMPLAVIASEDQRFRSHWGFDVEAITTAVEAYQQGEGLRGASTISQQTAKNLFLWGGRQFVRKALEAGFTLGLEILWPKRRIMEVYLNIAEFGDGIYGVEMASRHYFGVSARNLSLSQAARLAAVLPNPKERNAAASSDYMYARVDWISRQMRQLGGAAHVKSLMQP